MKKYFWQKIKNNHLPFLIGVPAMIWQVLFFYVPLFFIIYSSLQSFSGHTSFTLENLWLFLKPPYFKAIFNSMILALSNTLLCLLIGYPFAYFLAFSKARFKNLFLFFLIIPFLTNFLLHVYAWFYVLETHGFLNTLLLWTGMIKQPVHYLNSWFSIMIMMVYYYMPFMALPIYAVLERFDKTLIEASTDLGANRFETLKNITLPLSANGITAGFFLVYIPSFGEFVIPELMGGDKFLFVGNVISLYILGEQTGSLGSAFTIISVVVIIASAFLFYKLINYFLHRK